MRLTLLLLILVGLNHQTLHACKCDVKDDIKAHFEGTEVIVHGKVISKEYVDFGQSLTAKGLDLVCEYYENNIEALDFLNKDFLIKVELEVIETYKGQELRKRISVYTARPHKALGYLPPQKQYLELNSLSGTAQGIKNDNFDEVLEK